MGSSNKFYCYLSCTARFLLLFPYVSLKSFFQNNQQCSNFRNYSCRILHSVLNDIYRSKVFIHAAMVTYPVTTISVVIYALTSISVCRFRGMLKFLIFELFFLWCVLEVITTCPGLTNLWHINNEKYPQKCFQSKRTADVVF